MNGHWPFESWNLTVSSMAIGVTYLTRESAITEECRSTVIEERHMFLHEGKNTLPAAWKAIRAGREWVRCEQSIAQKRDGAAAFVGGEFIPAS